MKTDPLLDIERTILGSMLCSSEMCRTAIRIFSEKDFKRPGHRAIFQSMQTLIASGRPIDCVTVAELLRKKGSLEIVGGAGAVVALIGFASDVAPFEYYAKRLKGEFDQR